MRKVKRNSLIHWKTPVISQHSIKWNVVWVNKKREGKKVSLCCWGGKEQVTRAGILYGFDSHLHQEEEVLLVLVSGKLQRLFS